MTVTMAAVFTLFGAMLFIPYFKKTFGGITGDHIGLSIELSQVLFMLLIIMISGIRAYL